MKTKLDVDGWTVNDLMDLYIADKLCVDQRYQRKLVWNIEDKALFIDSLMSKYPIPNIMMVEYEQGDEDENSYGIIDGLQRINAIISFMLGEFQVKINNQMGYFDINSATGTFDLFQNGKIEQKEPVLDRQKCIDFRSYKLPIISTSHNDETIDEIFKRLNSTGTKLSRQDLRQAGALNGFSQLVRRISSGVRKSKTLVDIVSLAVMPQISLSNKDLNYGVCIDDVFWRKHGILPDEYLRKSLDEEIIATVLGSFLLERPLSVITPAVLDNLYDDKTEDAIIVCDKLKKSHENVEVLFLQMFNEIEILCDESELSLSDILFEGNRRKIDMFMILYKVLLQMYFENKTIIDHKGLAEMLKESKQSILNKLEEKTAVEYAAENNTIKYMSEIIRPYISERESANNKLRNEIINRLNLASVETQFTEFKVGLTCFNCPQRIKHLEGRLNFKNVSKIAKVACAMANERIRRAVGMIIIGVADNEDSYQDWRDNYKQRAYKYQGHRVVGIDAEARVYYKTIDNMLRALKERIDTEPISDEMKENLKHYDLISIQNKTLIVFSITAKCWQLYDGKKYVREGSDIKIIE